jgi:ferredoxin
MALKIIADECTACGDCKPACPSKSITEKGGVFRINAETCTECEGEADSPQCVAVCPGGDNTIAYI